MAKLNRPNGKLFGSSATNIGVFGSGQTGETPTTSTNPDAINTLGTHWEDGWNGAVVSQAPYTAPFVEDMNAVNYVNSYNGAYLLQQGIPEYSKNADYYVDSVCTYNGKIYMCILDNPAVNPDPDDPNPDAPPINYPLTDTTHWNERVELPDMNDNEVLVGSIGGTGVATDTLNQGDIVASSGGLDIKAQAIMNADVNDSAAISETKLDLDYSTDSLNTAITNKSISNLKDTNITTPIGAGDVIAYDDVNSKWINSNALANHLTDTNNPHDTSMANLDDTNVNDRQTLADGDVMVYDLANTDWVNSPSLKNHLSDTNNPHTTTLANLDDTTITTPQDGDAIIYDNNNSKWVNTPLPGGAISTLSDTTITSPQDGELLQYDYANSKWVNSNDIPTRIEVNNITYVGVTPNGHLADGNNDVQMLATDNRQQYLDTTGGYNIKLPKIGIKKGEKFTFICPKLDVATNNQYIHFKGSDGSSKVYMYTGDFIYEFIAVVDEPTTANAWAFTYRTRNTRYTVVYGRYEENGLSVTAGSRKTKSGSTLFTLNPGLWQISLDWYFLNGNSPSSTSNPWWVALCYSNNQGVAQCFDYDRVGGAFGSNIPMGGGGSMSINSQTVYYAQMSPFSVTKLLPQNKVQSVFITISIYSNSNATINSTARVNGRLEAPKLDALAT